MDPEKQKNAKVKFAGKNIFVASNLRQFIKDLETPKKILLMVPAGLPVDAVLADLKPLVKKSDIVIDGGNSFFANTTERTKKLKKDGIYFIGTGISGGEQGALWGPSIMPGGDPAGWPMVKPLLQSIAAKADDGIPCCDWVGNDGAGHFVKMIHNGIEYGDMQMISEAYFLLEQLMGLGPWEMADIFEEWNKGELNSYLIEITSKISVSYTHLTLPTNREV